MRLIGAQFPGGTTCHIIIRSIFKYSKMLLNHEKSLPLWSNIFQEQTEKYKNSINPGNSKLTLPIINIPLIINAIKTKTL